MLLNKENFLKWRDKINESSIEDKDTIINFEINDILFLLQAVMEDEETLDFLRSEIKNFKIKEKLNFSFSEDIEGTEKSDPNLVIAAIMGFFRLSTRDRSLFSITYPYLIHSALNLNLKNRTDVLISKKEAILYLYIRLEWFVNGCKRLQKRYTNFSTIGDAFIPILFRGNVTEEIIRENYKILFDCVKFRGVSKLTIRDILFVEQENYLENIKSTLKIIKKLREENPVYKLLDLSYEVESAHLIKNILNNFDGKNKKLVDKAIGSTSKKNALYSFEIFNEFKKAFPNANHYDGVIFYDKFDLYFYDNDRFISLTLKNKKYTKLEDLLSPSSIRNDDYFVEDLSITLAIPFLKMSRAVNGEDGLFIYNNMKRSLKQILFFSAKILGITLRNPDGTKCYNDMKIHKSKRTDMILIECIDDDEIIEDLRKYLRKNNYTDIMDIIYGYIFDYEYLEESFFEKLQEKFPEYISDNFRRKLLERDLLK